MQQYILFFLLFIPLWIGNVVGQTTPTDSTTQLADKQFQLKTLIVPTVLIGYGIIGTQNNHLNTLNSKIKEKVMADKHKKVAIDDFLQLSPAAAVYGLNMLGIEGKNDFKNRTVILGTSFLIMRSTVTLIKFSSNVERPDGSERNSFPSGHTATAFMGAEFLWQEYKDVSIWYGIAGYTIATATGALRIYNNRHWLTDVAAGAGIGIVSTKIAYWINPYIQQKVFKQKKQSAVALSFMPYYNGNQTGIGFLLSFN